MTREKKANEVRSAILKLVRQGIGLSANEIRVILALERIVARLSAAPKLDKHLVYKGGFVLLKTLGSNRFTRDLDALGVDLDKSEIANLVPAALALDLHDGFWFGEAQVEDLAAQGEYGALRFDCAYQIGDPPAKKEAIKKLSRIHFDVGFGDAIATGLKRTVMPSLLPADSTTWSASQEILARKTFTILQFSLTSATRRKFSRQSRRRSRAEKRNFLRPFLNSPKASIRECSPRAGAK